LEGLTTSSNSSKKSFNHTAKGILGSVSAELEEEAEPPSLKAAAADLRGAFTAAAAEAGEEDKECSPALKAATADPAGTFTAAAAEAGNCEEPEVAAGNACANVGGIGGAEELVGKPRTAITGDTNGNGCEVGVEEEEPVVEMSWFFAGSTRSL
jgi:hypothetical protein